MLRRQTHHWGPPLGSRQACSPRTPGHHPPETRRISPCLSETVGHKECQITHEKRNERNYQEY